MQSLFRGTWYRSQVKLEKDTIIAIPPFEPYNPFEWYYSAGEARQGERSLYLEFLDVDNENPEAVTKFCERFGVLGNTLVSSHLAQKSKEANFSKTMKGLIKGGPQNPPMVYITSLLQEIPMPLSHFRQEQEDLADAIQYSQGNLPHPAERPVFEPLERYVNKTIKEASVDPQLQWNVQKDQWELTWSSLTLTGYFTLMFMLDLLGPGNILSCPRCQKFFMTASNRMKYCSPSCYQNFKVQKYQRKRKEEELVAQKKKKVKPTQYRGKKK